TKCAASLPEERQLAHLTFRETTTEAALHAVAGLKVGWCCALSQFANIGTLILAVRRLIAVLRVANRAKTRASLCGHGGCGEGGEGKGGGDPHRGLSGVGVLRESRLNASGLPSPCSHAYQVHTSLALGARIRLCQATVRRHLACS